MRFQQMSSYIEGQLVTFTYRRSRWSIPSRTRSCIRKLFIIRAELNYNILDVFFLQENCIFYTLIGRSVCLALYWWWPFLLSFFLIYLYESYCMSYNRLLAWWIQRGTRPRSHGWSRSSQLRPGSTSVQPSWLRPSWSEGRRNLPEQHLLNVIVESLYPFRTSTFILIFITNHFRNKSPQHYILQIGTQSLLT